MHFYILYLDSQLFSQIQPLLSADMLNVQNKPILQFSKHEYPDEQKDRSEAKAN